MTKERKTKQKIHKKYKNTSHKFHKVYCLGIQWKWFSENNQFKNIPLSVLLLTTTLLNKKDSYIFRQFVFQIHATNALDPAEHFTKHFSI